MKLFRNLFKIVLVLLVLSILLFWQTQKIETFMQQPMNIPDEGISIQINKGDNLNKLWSRLEQQKIIERGDYPQWYARWYKRGENIKAGEYAIPFGTTPLQMLARLEKGDVTRYNITLVEGWTFNQIINALKNTPALSHQITSAQLADGKQLFAALQIENPLAQNPEGLFFPDTYQFVRGDSDLSILRRAYVRMQDVLNEEWEKRQKGLPFQKPYEALILASLVEKETGVVKERAQIAGVFVLRLQKNMLLQTDPAIIYGLGKNYDGNLRSADLKDDTNPYNTYRHAGLPPTPIALVGREAIRAALQPKIGKDLYFVARGDGSHHFSATYAEHNRAVQRYQLARREDYRSAPDKSKTDEKIVSAKNEVADAVDPETVKAEATKTKAK